MECKTAYLALGANLGNTRENLRSAVRLLEGSGQCDVVAASSLYLTRPVGLEDQPDFVNAVVEIKTMLSPAELLRLRNNVEETLGRKRTIRWGPRVIDIDILLYGDMIACEEDLVIPHPRMMERGFVLLPLAEIAPDVKLPGGETAAEAAHRVGYDGVERIEGGAWSE